MGQARGLSTWIGLIGVAVALAAMNVASAVFAPVAFALFLIALLWPLQRRLQASLPQSVALAISILVLVTAFAGFASLIVWGFGRVARWVLANLSRFQAIYDQTTAWLEDQGIVVASLWTDHFNVGWLVGLMQKLTGQVNTALSFWVVVLVYVILGLLEVDGTARKIHSLPDRGIVHLLTEGSAKSAARIRRYMAV